MKQTHEPYPGVVVYRRLVSHALPYWKVFAIGVIAMVFYAATDTGFAALMKPMLDGSFVEQDPDMIRLVPMLLIGLFLVRGITGFISKFCTGWVGRRVVTDLRGKMFNHLLTLPARYYDNISSGALLSKLMYNVEQVAAATTTAVTVLIRDSLTILGLLAWMIYLDLFLAMVFLVVGPFIGASIRLAGRRLRRLSHRVQESMGLISHTAEEAIEGHRVVKVFGGKDFERARFRRVNENNRRQQMKQIVTDAVSNPVIQLIAACALAGVVYLATSPTMQEKISVGTFVSFLIAMSMLLAPLKRVTSVNAHVQRGVAAGQSIFALLDTESERDNGRVELDRARGEIEFEDVSHVYDAEKGSVLKGISLSIAPGETVALVGRSGSGKSTLASLLLRFYDCTSGVIRMDGHDLETLRLSSLRRQIAVVAQDVTLFNASIAENIGYGAVAATEEDIARAAQAAHAMEFIRRLPEGMQTLVGENGIRLSGGQRQRIAIARAVLKDAPVLILDEATASLDSESEKHIQAALDDLRKDRTTLVIAHRLSTVEKADRIVVLENGEIVEIGRHAELLARGGQYAELHRLQFSAASPPETERDAANS